jgi:hypothetical protein
MSPFRYVNRNNSFEAVRSQVEGATARDAEVGSSRGPRSWMVVSVPDRMISTATAAAVEPVNRVCDFAGL